MVIPGRNSLQHGEPGENLAATLFPRAPAKTRGGGAPSSIIDGARRVFLTFFMKVAPRLVDLARRSKTSVLLVSF